MESVGPGWTEPAIVNKIMVIFLNIFCLTMSDRGASQKAETAGARHSTHPLSGVDKYAPIDLVFKERRGGEKSEARIHSTSCRLSQDCCLFYH